MVLSFPLDYRPTCFQGVTPPPLCSPRKEMSEEDVGGVDFVHEAPALLLDAERGHGGEAAELFVSPSVVEKLARKGAENLVNALQDLRLLVGEKEWLAGIKLRWKKEREKTCRRVLS